MPRPPLDPGTFGSINTLQVGPSRYRAQARFRGQDGVTRTVSRSADTKGRAERALKKALAEQQARGASITRDTPIGELLTRWLDEVDQSDRAATTKELYRYTVGRYLRPALGSLRVAEATTARCDALLQRVRGQHGPAAARSCRAILNGVFAVAIRNDALTVNPVRETNPIASRARPPRALSSDEIDDLTDRARSDERAVMLELPDLIDFGLATGCRIGEALALRDEFVTINDEGAAAEIAATAVRLKGRGMLVQERTKTEAGHRALPLPSQAAQMVLRRRSEARLNARLGLVLDAAGKVREEMLTLVFPSARGTVRDPSNTSSDLRELLDRLGYPWVTFHTFRRTALTQLLAAGMSPQEVSDFAGHSQTAMTLNRYAGRDVVAVRAASILER